MLTIHLRPCCPYCENTLEVIDKLNISKKKIKKYIYNSLEEREECKKKLNKYTFPQIYFKDISIGGNDDFVHLVNQCLNSEKDQSLNDKISTEIVNEFCNFIKKKKKKNQVKKVKKTKKLKR